ADVLVAEVLQDGRGQVGLHGERAALQLGADAVLRFQHQAVDARLPRGQVKLRREPIAGQGHGQGGGRAGTRPPLQAGRGGGAGEGEGEGEVAVLKAGEVAGPLDGLLVGGGAGVGGGGDGDRGAVRGQGDRGDGGHLVGVALGVAGLDVVGEVAGDGQRGGVAGRVGAGGGHLVAADLGGGLDDPGGGGGRGGAGAAGGGGGRGGGGAGRGRRGCRRG